MKTEDIEGARPKITIRRANKPMYDNIDYADVNGSRRY